ncbi:MAG: hypothetical protein WBM39_03965 [Parasphingorhabdus sp.]
MTRATRSDRNVQATPARNRGDRAGQGNGRPTRAIQQPQARPAQASSPPRPETPRQSPRTNPNARERLSDE